MLRSLLLPRAPAVACLHLLPPLGAHHTPLTTLPLPPVLATPPPLQGTWFVPCQYNEAACHRRLVAERALGVANLARLAGYHRYSASWAGGNAAGVHSMRAVQAAICGAPQPPPTAGKPAACPAVQPCAPQPCIVAPAAAAGAGAAAAGAGAAAGNSSGKPDGAALPKPRALVPPRTRWGIGALLEQEQLQTGAELGVQVGPAVGCCGSIDALDAPLGGLAAARGAA